MSDSRKSPRSDRPKLFAAVAVSVCLISSARAADNNPVADPKAIVVSGHARFTVLTPALVRMEWSADGKFEDHASLVILNRRLPVPAFTASSDQGWLTIRTDGLVLRYDENTGKFTSDNLDIRFDCAGQQVAWRPGTEDRGNLKGTIRTLDGVKGATELEPGLLSRDGWVLVDDSERPLFDDSDWPWVMPRPSGDRQDWYFFAYGHEYKRELYDFTRVAGPIPMPPRFAFGVWWSRYWGYTDEEFKELVHEFEIHDVPLDVLVIDMDWHQTFNQRWGRDVRDQAGQTLGWTGYTWDRIKFPDPEGFLSWCDRKGLKTPLNLHPASGIQPFEDHYTEMAQAMGIDPTTKRYIPFDITDKKFATSYMGTIIRPLEKQGVDFWWLDWQQWSTTKIPGVTPTWWLNYVFFSAMERKAAARPLLFHRWGGLGNHRYQIGFSGDVISVWESLAFQPYFTATASNVGFGYWSHDIGGHMPGELTPDLYTRWIQFGVFSPILRTHTTKNPRAERRIWAYPNDYFMMMRDAFLLRYSLIPYLYTSSRLAYETGVSICRPMYYDSPDDSLAYQCKDEYKFGDDMLVAPVAASVSPESLLVPRKVWLPNGDWWEWYTGTKIKGGRVVERLFAEDEIPVYLRAGAIIPMQPKMRYSSERPVDPLILMIVPGTAGSTRVYEDEGNSLGYQHGEYAWTLVRQKHVAEERQQIEIFPADGRYQGMPQDRAYELRLPATFPPGRILCNGKEIAFARTKDSVGWTYDGEHVMTVIRLPRFGVDTKVEVMIAWPADAARRLALLDGVPGLLARLRRVSTLLNSQWPKEWSPDDLLSALETGNRITLHPQDAVSELGELAKSLPSLIKEIRSLDITKEVITRSINHLSAGNDRVKENRPQSGAEPDLN